ncbi:MAG: glycine cleavage system aminomethyltransferase GcvT, partial [Pseudomonadota bacterium]
HMTILDLHGPRTREFLQHLLANDVARLREPGKALYSCMLNEQGKVIDDLIVYFMHDEWFRVVVNAATRDKDLAWINQHARQYQLQAQERKDLAMIAVQGPQARAKVLALLPPAERARVEALAAFYAADTEAGFIARTGYTGEDGFEILVPATHAPQWWQRLLHAGVKPAGLGARDTLRLEAGMNLYGQDMDETTHPLESGLGWTIAWEPKEREFIGRTSLEEVRTRGNIKKFVGLVLEEKGVLRAHQKVVVEGIGEGETTSGTFSPTLNLSIALARVPAATGERVMVEIRGKLYRARVVKPVFVRHGKALV